MCINPFESINCDMLVYGVCAKCKTECIVKANKRSSDDLAESLVNQESDLLELSECINELVTIVDNLNLEQSNIDTISDLKEMISGQLEELEDFRKILLINMLILFRDNPSN